jgi:hypothetical protein
VSTVVVAVVVVAAMAVLVVVEGPKTYQDHQGGSKNKDALKK